jgi:RimK family alpha-L-glutamate ligase
MLAKYPFNANVVRKEFKFPVIIKTVSGSKGNGVFLCKTKSNLQDMLELVSMEKDSKTLNLIVQEYIKSSRGRDLRVFVVGGRVVGAMLRTAKNSRQFKANFSQGGKVEEFQIDQECEWIALESAKILGLEIAGVDILFGEDGYVVCEVNSSPGFVGFEEAIEIDIPQILFDYIRLRLNITEEDRE